MRLSRSQNLTDFVTHDITGDILAFVVQLGTEEYVLSITESLCAVSRSALLDQGLKSSLPHASKINKVTVGPFRRETDINRFLVERKWDLLVHKTDFGFDSELGRLAKLDVLNRISATLVNGNIRTYTTHGLDGHSKFGETL